MTTNSCPCCGGSLLRHVRHQEVYWFCRTCWQEIPILCISQAQGVNRKEPETQVKHSLKVPFFRIG